MTRTKQHYRRGYPLAILLGLEERRAVLWRVFSEVVKLDGTVERRAEAEKGNLYDFHESIVNALRPTLKEGVGSVVIVAPARTDHATRLLDHIRKHHGWLVQGHNAATFGELTGSAGQPHEVHELVKTRRFREVIGRTATRDAENIVAVLGRGLDSNNSSIVVSYSLEEIEDLVYGRNGRHGFMPEHLVLTNRYLADTKDKARIQRLLQISQNKGIKTTIVSAETGPGLRLGQLGGLVCLAKSSRKRGE